MNYEYVLFLGRIIAIIHTIFLVNLTYFMVIPLQLFFVIVKLTIFLTHHLIFFFVY